MKDTIFVLAGCLVAGLLTCDTILAQDNQSTAVNRDDFKDSQIVSMTIYPATEPSPALMYRMYPHPDEMIDRNAAIYYHRARDLEKRGIEMPEMPEYGDETYNYIMTCPVDELPMDVVDLWVRSYREMFLELERARISSRSEWGLLPGPGEDLERFWFNISLDELQRVRNFVRTLSIKARIEIKEGRIEDALRTIQTCYKAGQDVGKSGFLIGDLIGIAVIGITNRTVREMMQQPESPSLYWALGTLPDPVIESRNSVEQELDFILGSKALNILQDAGSKNLSIEQWRTALFESGAGLHAISGMDHAPHLGIEASSAALAVRGYPIAKKALIDSGMDAANVEAMPVVQVLSIHQTRVVEKANDEIKKLLGLPFRQSLEALQNIEEEVLPKYSFQTGSSVFPVIDLVMPALDQVVQADARIRNRMASLKVIAAIRLHMGQTGQMPESLSDITIVPVPDNVFTGQPFDYERTATGATLYDKTGPRSKYNWMIFDLTMGEAK